MDWFLYEGTSVMKELMNIEWIFVFEENCSVLEIFRLSYTPQKIKFFIKEFFSKCDQIRRKMQIWSHFLKKSLTENFIFCAVIPSLFLIKI